MASDGLFAPLRDAALSAGRLRTAVAYPLSASSLGAAVQARAAISSRCWCARAHRAAAGGIGPAAGGLEIIDAPDDELESARAAAALARDGAVGMLMKGSLHSDHFMAAVVARESGLRTARRISHAFVMSVAAYPKLFILTDAAVNIAPTLAEKADIAQNAIDLARSLGVDRPKVAVLCATESVNPSMPATLDAAALSKMADRMQIRGALVDGPLALDNAISREAAELKGIASPVAGQADILLAPDIEAGNMLYKELTWLAGAGAGWCWARACRSC
ncbi:bifunctional enoyl-CoA hydratase/phosphate acetyltransferase [Achromobacter xylosoxidans]